MSLLPTLKTVYPKISIANLGKCNLQNRNKMPFTDVSVADWSASVLPSEPVKHSEGKKISCLEVDFIH